MKKYILTFVFALALFVPSLTHAQVVDTTDQATYVSLLKQMISLLEQELQLLIQNQQSLNSIASSTAQTSQNTTTPTPVSTGGSGSDNVGKSSFQVYNISYASNPSYNYIQIDSSKKVDATTVQIAESNGFDSQDNYVYSPIDVQLTVLDSRTLTDSAYNHLADGTSIDLVKGGEMVRFTPSQSLVSGKNYRISFKSVAGDTYTGSINYIQ